MKIEVNDPILLRIAAYAQKKDVQIFAVGGYVRDSIMGRPRTDIDVTVVGDAAWFATEIAVLFNSKAVVYERFRTALVPIGSHHIEFVGTRKEVYDPVSRKPTVEEGTLDDDLRRRDFTVNAMAASLSPETLGNVIDLFDGCADIERRLLRTPLDPFVTMTDDPLRMMRAARFASQLDFTLHPSAVNAMKQLASRITIISQERITDEFLKILASPKPSVGLGILYDVGILKIVFPEVHQLAGVELVQEGSREYGHKDVFRHTLRVVDNVAQMSDNLWLRFATLMHDVAKPKTKRFAEGHGWTFHGHEDVGARWQEKIFLRMKMPLDKLDYVRTLVRLHQRPMQLVDEGITDSAIRRLAVSAGDSIDDLFTLCRADITTRNPQRAQAYLRNYETVQKKVKDVLDRDHLRAFQSPVRGDEIMEIAGLPPSRTVGYMKWMIEEAILEGLIPNEYDAARQFFIEHVEEWKQNGETAHFSRRG